MLTSAIIAPANHLLRSEKWGCESLRVHAGRAICIQALPLINLTLQINEHGELQSVGRLHAVDTTMRFSPLQVPSLLAQESRAFDRIQIAGDEELAKALIVIGKNINWAAILAQDVSGVIGDVAAHRLGRSAEQLMRWQAGYFDRVTQTVTEYLIEEKDYLIKDVAIRKFSEEVQNLQHDTAQLEQRLMQLMQHSMLASS